MKCAQHIILHSAAVLKQYDEYLSEFSSQIRIVEGMEAI